MRNVVYDLLFKRDSHVLLQNTAAYHRNPPDHNEYAHSAEDYAANMEQFYIDYENEFGLDRNFRHGFHEGISILLSCRQVYHEAVGVLYGRNTFKVSAVQARHDVEYEAYLPLIHTSIWLSSLGSQMVLLTKIIIDVETMCPIDCIDVMLDYELYGLVRLIWVAPELSKVIAFGCSGRLEISQYNHNRPSTGGDHDSWPICLADMLNNALTAIGTNDVLNLKRYNYTDRLIDSIFIYPEDNLGCVTYKHAYDEAIGPSFAVSHDGTSCTQIPDETRRIHELPPSILRRVYEFACNSTDGVTVDPNSRKLQGLDLGLLQTNRKLRHEWHLIGYVFRMNTILIKQTSTDATTDLEGLVLCKILSVFD